MSEPERLLPPLAEQEHRSIDGERALLYFIGERMYDAMLDGARHHITGLFGELPYAPETYPAQNAATFKLDQELPDGRPVPIGELEFIASTVLEDFGRLQDELKQDERSMEIIDRVVEHLLLGGNIVHATNHKTVHDIALNHGLINLAVRDRDEAAMRANMIIVNKALAGYGIAGSDTAALELLIKLSSVGLSFPGSRSMKKVLKKLGLPKGITSHMNDDLKQDVAELQEEGGFMLAIAPSSSTSVFRQWRGQDSHVMDSFRPGTIEMLTDPNTLVLTSSLTMKGTVEKHRGKEHTHSASQFAMGDLFRVENEDQAHLIGHHLAELESTQLERPVAYRGRKGRNFEGRLGEICVSSA